jgi:uncharacterized protein
MHLGGALYNNRYVLDPLYGPVSLPGFAWSALAAAEVQRLREVRLCNINSLTLTGAGAVDRFEHSVGTAQLALRCVDAWPVKLPKAQARHLVLSALLHDVGSPAFGHSVQYILDMYGYRHDSLSDILDVASQPGSGSFRYRVTTLEPVYFGSPRTLPEILTDEDLRAVSNAISGTGSLGPLISGTMDLDNIDNVYRLAYHSGLSSPGKRPETLAESLYVADGTLLIRDNAIELVEDWYETRRLLYSFLLLNADEFSGKCMLEEALSLASLEPSVLRWQDTDFALMEKLSSVSPETQEIVSRLMLGDLYGCVGIYSSSRIDAYERMANPKLRSDLEADLSTRIRGLTSTRPLRSASIALHAIRDVDKTSRQVALTTFAGRKITVGTSSRRLLIGVFLRNKSFSVNQIDPFRLLQQSVNREVEAFLKDAIGDPELQGIRPYDERDLFHGYSAQ